MATPKRRKTRGTSAICLALICTLALSRPANALPADEKPEWVQVQIESVDLSTGRITYKSTPESAEVLEAVISSRATKHGSRLKPGKKAWVRIAAVDSRPTIVNIGRSPWRTVLIVAGVVVAVLLVIPFFVIEEAVVVEPVR